MAVTFHLDNQIGFIELDDDRSKVNVLSEDVLTRLNTILDEISGRDDVKTLVFRSLKNGQFIAGADLNLIRAIQSSDEGTEKARLGQDLMNRIEDLPIPTVALINGVTLGGGCELALACSCRVATTHPKVKIGLPEIGLGFVPGFGGTYRLPRLVGLAPALQMILTYQPVDARKASRMGLIDRVIPEAGMMDHLRDYLSRSVLIDPDRRRKPSLKGMNKILNDSLIGNAVIFHQARKNVLKKTGGFYPAPLEAVDLIRKTYYLKRTEALRREAEAFGRLAVTDVSRNLIHVFDLMEAAKKFQPSGTENARAAEITKVAVIGAGVMGGGIAQLLSSRDIWCRMKDITTEALGAGLKAAADIYRKGVQRRKFSKAEAAGKMAKISATLDSTGCESADLVIEAVVEKTEIKQNVFRELSGIIPDHAILASNTSAIPIAKLASAAARPERVVGFHFFNPVHRMPLVEIIRTKQTSADTVVTMLALARRLGKTPIVVEDSCGFLVNRVLLSYMAEAGRLLEECGELEEIDEVMTDFGMPMGPFTLSDEVGLDVGLKVMQTLCETFGERFRPAGIFQKIYEKKLLGKKTGSGFYRHGKDLQPNPDVFDFFEGISGVLERSSCEKRLIYMMINEAARCLEDKVVESPSVVDTGMIFGTGFPPFRGGLLKYADALGLQTIVEEMRIFNTVLETSRFEPCDYLVQLAENNRGFYSQPAT